MKKTLTTLLLLTLLLSCSRHNKKLEKTNAETTYIEAAKLLEKKSYSEAATEFEKIDDEYPFSRWAVKAQTMAVYARYKNEEYAKVVANVDDFLRLNPSSEYVPYMLYMKGVTYYNQIPDIKRAQDNTQQVSFLFRELIARFPESNYAEDARSKLSFIDEHLAGAKMAIGRYQLQTRNYVGAIISFNEVIARYRYTQQVPEAYYRLVEVYSKIGLKKEALKVNFELHAQFPGNEWAKAGEKFSS